MEKEVVTGRTWNWEDLGQALKMSRQQAHLTQVQVEYITGISRTNLYRWERGGRDVHLEYLANVLAAYQLIMDIEIISGQITFTLTERRKRRGLAGNNGTPQRREDPETVDPEDAG